MKATSNTPHFNAYPIPRICASPIDVEVAFDAGVYDVDKMVCHISVSYGEGYAV